VITVIVQLCANVKRANKVCYAVVLK